MSDNVLQKMRNANIPAFTFDTNLIAEKGDSLRAILANKEFKTTDGLASYVVGNQGSTTPLRATRLVSVMAKELVLTGQKVKFLPLGGLIRELRITDYTNDISDIYAMVGKGYFVIPDFDDEHHDEKLWVETQAFLISHVNQGGGLVLAVRHPWHTGRGARYTRSFDTVSQSFTYLEV